jgi:hypothetical protein
MRPSGAAIRSVMGAKSRISYGSPFWSAALITNVTETTSSVCPSGVAFATTSAPTTPEAAGRLSTITGCPSFSESLVPM